MNVTNKQTSKPTTLLSELGYTLSCTDNRLNPLFQQHAELEPINPAARATVDVYNTDLFLGGLSEVRLEGQSSPWGLQCQSAVDLHQLGALVSQVQGRADVLALGVGHGHVGVQLGGGVGVLALDSDVNVLKEVNFEII